MSRGTRRRTRQRRPSLVALALAWATAALGAPQTPVVVGPLKVTATEIAQLLDRLAPAELRTYGSSLEAARLGYVRKVLVPELLVRAESERLGLQRDPAVRARLRDVLFQSLVEAERAELPDVHDDEVASYYEANRRDFERPERIALWRILVSTEEAARDLLESVRGPGGLERWRTRAREASLDTATNERGGNLGFVHPDGSTDVPELRVDPKLFEAAQKVQDGELVPEPVPEGDRYAVVWRRGSLRPAHVPTSVARATIERHINDQKLFARLDELVQHLAKKHVQGRQHHLLENLNVPAFPED